MNENEINEFKYKLLKALLSERQALYQLLRSFDRITETENSIVVRIPKGVFRSYKSAYALSPEQLKPFEEIVNQLVVALPQCPIEP